jgi:outer membrane protein assembly factor BamB
MVATTAISASARSPRSRPTTSSSLSQSGHSRPPATSPASRRRRSTATACSTSPAAGSGPSSPNIRTASTPSSAVALAAGTYDADTDTLIWGPATIWGTGNAVPGTLISGRATISGALRSSLLALDPDTAKIKWGYQYTPNDARDYDRNNGPILIDTTIDGHPVKAAVQSNRNGFLYVLDRNNGKFMYAVPTVEGINWTTGSIRRPGNLWSTRASAREAAVPRSRTSYPASKAAPTGSRWPTTRTSATSTSRPTTGRRR